MLTTRNLLIVFSLAWVLLGAACASLNINLPSVTDTPTGLRLPGKVIWRDLLTNDPAASQRFYGELFGWEFESVGTASSLKSDSAYTLIRHNGQLIGGMIDTIALNNRDDISQWVILISVEDLDARVETVVSSGGRLIAPPTDLQDRGRLAVIRDPQGALLGLLETLDGDPRDSEPAVDGFLWDELWTSDVNGAARFYGDVTGLVPAVLDTDDNPETVSDYTLLNAGETARAGILANPLEGLDPVWVTYIRVENPAAVTSRVTTLGGRVIVEAGPRAVGGSAAFVAGPSGAGIALQTWPLETQD